MDSSVLRRAHSDGVVTLTLNRPERLNAINPELLRALISGLEGATESDYAVVLRGEGRAFCAGWDLKESADRVERGQWTPEGAIDDVNLLQDATRALHKCPVPVIAVIHGFAVGAGSELVFGCDLVIAGESARFGFPETGVGMAVTNGMTSVLPKAVGLVLAKELILLGEQIPAARAKELGLINRVVPDVLLDAALGELVEALRKRSRAAVAANMRLLDEGVDSTLESALDREAQVAVALDMHDETQAAMTAFRNSRASVFAGR